MTKDYLLTPSGKVDIMVIFREYNTPIHVIRKFIRFLIAEGAYEKFMSNLYHQLILSPQLIERYEDTTPLSIDKFLCNLTTGRPSDIIASFFHWKVTPEGYTYWCELNNKWEVICRGIKIPVFKK